MALAGARYDLVIAVGFDLSYNTKLTDKLEINNHTGSKIKEIKEYTSY